MKRTMSIAGRFLAWRLRHISDRQFLVILSIIIGIITGIVAVVIKNSAHYIRTTIQDVITANELKVAYIIFPAIGILFAVLFVLYIIRKPVRPGIPNVLYGISKDNGRISPHNMYSSIVTSSITVGFGGSVGLEGPTVTTCAAWGSFLGRIMHLNYKQITLLLACASAATISAIFKAPIAAIVFALEVIMLDLTMWSLVPLLMASMASVLTSYFFVGQDLLYPFEVVHKFQLNDIVWYIGLGIFCGLISSYFTKVYLFFEGLFQKMHSIFKRVLFGGLLLGILVFFFPSLYGEGYEDINSCLSGGYDYLFDGSIFQVFSSSQYALLIMFLVVLLAKAVAASVTVGAGGVGGIFAPSLYIGASSGVFFATAINMTGIADLHVDNFSLIGMGGMIAGVLHAPLTGIFLIADISGGYHLFVPLMLTSTIAYATVKSFVPHSVYTVQLARRKELMTHDKDKVVLSLMKVERLVEKNFIAIYPQYSLGKLVEIISTSSRNIFPVVDGKGRFLGIVKLDNVRGVMFKHELYDSLFVRDFMFKPKYEVDINEDMDEVVKKFQISGRYNLVVLKDGYYEGFVSRAKVFSKYRRMLKHFSED
jgi:CIC family chloride channel protein